MPVSKAIVGTLLRDLASACGLSPTRRYCLEVVRAVTSKVIFVVAARTFVFYHFMNRFLVTVWRKSIVDT